MRAISVITTAALLLVLPMPVAGWGMDVHRFLTGHALDGMPAELRAFLAPRRDFIIEHSVDPDLWRIVGLAGERGDEPPNHYLDIDGLDEPPPFRNVPRDWDAYVARYGSERANQMGRLPWRVAEIHARLVRAFRDIGTGRAPYAADNARYLTAVLAHYIEDAHVPFHAVLNHDGQLTGQRGIHSRFETELVLRNLRRWTMTPARLRPIGNIRDDIFDRLVEGQALVDGILAADRQASAGRELFDDAYYRSFLAGVRPVVERRMNEAVSMVASAVQAAWIEAGKPDLTRPRTARESTDRR